MRKLLFPKKNNSKHENNTCFELRDQPRRTITSAWNTRNDSSNIGSILHPQVSINPSKQNVTPKGVYKKCPLSENTCYCKEKQKKIKPKLISRPKTCLSLEKLKRDLDTTHLGRRPLKKHWIDQKCICKENDTLGDSISISHALLGDQREEFPEKCDCLKYTESRKDYELFRRQQEEEDLKEIEEYHEKEMAEGSIKKSEEKQDESFSLSTILGTRLDTTKTTSSFKDFDEESPKSLDNLNAFRSSHFFETHSTTDLEKDRNASNHTCVHQYKLDDRLLPEPLNVDPFGRSRCTICSKPMEGETMQLSRSYFGDRPSRISLKNLAKCSELGLVPRSISIGGDRSKIEVKVNQNEKHKFGMFVGRIRKREYVNTLALRQQKMSCY